jgi:hypothetical protein
MCYLNDSKNPNALAISRGEISLYEHIDMWPNCLAISRRESIYMKPIDTRRKFRLFLCKSSKCQYIKHVECKKLSLYKPTYLHRKFRMIYAKVTKRQ